MKPEKVLRLMQRAGHKARIKNQEVLVRDCVFCGNPRWNLELNGPKGVYGCWACRTGGRLDDLLRQFANADVTIPVKVQANDQSGSRNPLLNSNIRRETKPAHEVTSARKYLQSRGLSIRDMYVYGIQVAMDKDDPVYGRILFPVQDYWTGEILGSVARAYYGHYGSKYLNLLERREIVGFRQGGERGKHILVEGVIDAIKVNKAGYQCGALLGLESGDLVKEWAALAPPDDDIIILMDGSAQEMAVKITTSISTFRDNTRLLMLPDGVDPGGLSPLVLQKFIKKGLDDGGN